MNWIVIREVQQLMLKIVFLEAQTPLLMAVDIDSLDGKTLILVPSSQKDQRCWKIDRNGEVARCDRKNGTPCRSNRFPKRILNTIPK